MQKNRSPLLLLGIVCLSLGWVLPNHYAPWSAFHTDAWIAFVLLCAAVVVTATLQQPTHIHFLSVVTAGCALIPLLQLAVGMHAFFGTAIVAALYLMGFLLAQVVGARCEAHREGQAADALFGAIGIASVVSVGLQLHQWLSLERVLIWDMGSTTGRPFANLGQPNMLGTFLLLGILATFWGLLRKFLSLKVAILLVAFLLVGVALTGSRTAWLAILILVALVWFWRTLLNEKRFPWVATALAFFFFACVGVKDMVLEGMLLGGVGDIVRVTNEPRLQVWLMFLEAASHRPLAGYGWSQISLAHTAIAADAPPFQVLFTYSHSFFLDLILWCGIPVGLLITCVVLYWLYTRFRAIRGPEDALLFTAILLVANHALFEFPLAYAYILLPLGVIVGVLDNRLSLPVIEIRSRWPVLCLCAVLAVALAIVVRDYLRVEKSYLDFRFEEARIATGASREPPDVILLTNLREMIRYFRYEPHKNMSEEELSWMRNVANLYPSAGVIHKIAAAMAWNHRPEEARDWLKRLCKLTHPDQCSAVQRAWIRQGEADSDIRAIPWPASERP